jgi:hypothetical protein
MKRHLERETTKLNENINRSSNSTKKKMEGVKADIDGIKEVLSTVYKDKLATFNAKK